MDPIGRKENNTTQDEHPSPPGIALHHSNTSMNLLTLGPRGAVEGGAHHPEKGQRERKVHV